MARSIQNRPITGPRGCNTCFNSQHSIRQHVFQQSTFNTTTRVFNSQHSIRQHVFQQSTFNTATRVSTVNIQYGNTCFNSQQSIRTASLYLFPSLPCTYNSGVIRLNTKWTILRSYSVIQSMNLCKQSVITANNKFHPVKYWGIIGLT